MYEIDDSRRWLLYVHLRAHMALVLKGFAALSHHETEAPVRNIKKSNEMSRTSREFKESASL